MVVDYINKVLVMLAIFLTPTIFGMVDDVTFNSVFPAGGVLALLLVLNIITVVSVKLTKSQVYLLLYVLINVISFLAMLLVYNDQIGRSYLTGVINSFVTSIVIMSSSVIYAIVIVKSNISIRNVQNYFFIGVASNAVILGVIVSIIGIQSYLSDPYSIRDLFHIYAEKQKNGYSSGIVESLPQWFGLYYQMMGGTAAIGPFFSMCGVFFIAYFSVINNKLKAVHLGAIGLLCVFLALLMASRSALISMLVALLITSIVLRSNDDRKKLHVFLSLGILVMISAMIMLIVMSETFSVLQMFKLEILINQPRIEFGLRRFI